MDSTKKTSLHSKLDHKCVHEENRMKVCAPCGKKIIFGKKKSNDFLISRNMNGLIKKHLYDQFDLSNAKFPLSICPTCRFTISELDKGSTKRPLLVMPNYIDYSLTKETRTTQFCSCYICVTAQFKGHLKVKKGKGHIRTFPTETEAQKALESTKQNELFSKNEKTVEKENSMDICTKCFQKRGKGIEHACTGSSTTARDNFSIIFELLPEKQQNQIITSHLKRKSDESNAKDELILNTSGSKARITLNKKQDQKVKFTTENLDNFQATTGLSTNNMNKVTNFIRTSAGRKSVPVNYRKHMQEKSTSMNHLYEEGIYQFEVEKDKIKKENIKDKKENGENEKKNEKITDKIEKENREEKKIENRPVVYAKAPKLLDFIFGERDIKQIEKSKIKIMADGGQKFFKVSIAVLPDEDDTGDSDEFEGQRVSYSSGGSCAKKRKLNSVYRLILLCIVPCIKETYENMKIIVELTQLNDIPFKFTSDFKLLLMVIGQQSASATCPCPYCFITLNDLKNNCIENANLKTFKHLKEDYNKFKSYGKNKKYAPECHSVVNHPLFVKEGDDEDDCIFVIQKCVLPELHLLQGFVNHLFWKGIVPIVGREKDLIWPKKLKLVAKNYQGEIFEGNACRKLLKEADKLADAEIYNEVGIFRLQPFIASFKAMNKIEDKYFTTKQVDLSDIDKNLVELRKAFQSTEVSQTLKIHVILDHLKEDLLYLNKDGLGLWSEQAGESIHREFLKYWERFKINMIDDPTFIIRLKKAAFEGMWIRSIGDTTIKKTRCDAYLMDGAEMTSL